MASTSHAQPPPFKKLPDEQRALLLQEYDNAQACIRCGLCLSVCPTYLVTRSEAESPRGRIAMARALMEGHLDLSPDLIQHQQSCLLCEACTAICPAGVHMEALGMPLRAALATTERPPWPQRWLRRLVFRGLFLNMARFRRLAATLRVAQQSGLVWLAGRVGLLRLLGLSQAVELLPNIDRQFLVPRGQTWEAESAAAPERVDLFAGCIMSTAYAATSRATARLLARTGRTVVAPACQACCGALHAHNGDLEGARHLARQNIEAFEDVDAPAIVVNAAGCGSMLKGYGRLLANDPAFVGRAEAFARRVRDLTELLAERQPANPPRPLERQAVFQPPCHLVHAQRVTAEPLSLLQRLPGLKLLALKDAAVCCGSAGVYNVTNPAMAQELQRRKIAAILESGADLVITANPGCLLQIQAGLRQANAPVEIRHIADVLSEAYGVEGSSA